MEFIIAQSIQFLSHHTFHTLLFISLSHAIPHFFTTTPQNLLSCHTAGTFIPEHLTFCPTASHLLSYHTVRSQPSHNFSNHSSSSPSTSHVLTRHTVRSQQRTFLVLLHVTCSPTTLQQGCSKRSGFGFCSGNTFS